MKSMTGYGRAFYETGNIYVDIEIRSVNSRFLKISLRVPQELGQYEHIIKKQIGQYISRGTLTITFSYSDEAPLENQKIDKKLLTYYYHELCSLANELKIDPPSLESIISLPDIIKQGNSNPVDKDKWNIVSRVLQEALNNMEQMRIKEGKYLKEEVEQYLTSIENKVLEIEKVAPQINEHYYKRLKNRIFELQNRENFHFSDDDLIKEVAIFAEKSDISEEISRVKSHLDQFKQNIDQGNAIGKTLEFILQEMVREVNTMASKANNYEASGLVVK
jgi:uncharacterized protein (TIGR00255 family)